MSETPQPDPYVPPSAPQEPPPASPDKVKRVATVFAVTVIVISALIFFSVLKHAKAPRQPRSIDSNFKGKPAPDFALKDLSGNTVHLSDYRGKAVVLNFWATWCPPCKAEMPWFVELQKQYGPQGLAIVGVSLDDDASPEQIAKFTHKLNVNYTILLGKDDVAKLYGGVDALPTTFYIDRNGTLVDVTMGLPSEREEIEDNVKRTLTSGKTSQNSPTTSTAASVGGRQH
jgi:peroxiredoxin